MGNRSSSNKVFNFNRILNIKKLKDSINKMSEQEKKDFLKLNTAKTNFQILNNSIVVFTNFEVKEYLLNIEDIISIEIKIDENDLLIQIHPHELIKFCNYF